MEKTESDIILSIDMGTSEIKTTLVNTSGLIGNANKKYGFQFPKPGYVEQDIQVISDAIYSTSQDVIKNSGIDKNNIIGVIFTGQMGGFIAVDIEGKPLINFIQAMDTRALDITINDMLKGWPKIMGYPLIKMLKFVKIAGGPPSNDGKSQISRLYWLKKERPEIYNKSHKILDLKDYAVFLATGQYLTSKDVAYITWMTSSADNHMKWSEDIIKMFGLDINMLPEIKNTIDIAGKTTKKFSEKAGVREGIPVIIGAGDLLTSAIGSGAINKGELHVSVGTAGWVGAHYPEKTIDVAHYVGTIASGIPDWYIIMCKFETLGGALEWYKNIIYPESEHTQSTFTEINDLVKKSQPGSQNLIFVPYLLGERSIINDGNCRGMFINLGMYHTRGDMFRAIYEGIAYNLRWGIEICEKLSKITNETIKFIGGASKSDEFCQIFADVWQRKVARFGESDAQFCTALGAATIAYVSLGKFKDFTEIKNMITIDKVFEPNPNNKEIYEELFNQYKQLYKRNKGLFKTLNRYSS